MPRITANARARPTRLMPRPQRVEPTPQANPKSGDFFERGQRRAGVDAAKIRNRGIGNDPGKNYQPGDCENQPGIFPAPRRHSFHRCGETSV